MDDLKGYLEAEELAIIEDEKALDLRKQILIKDKQEYGNKMFMEEFSINVNDKVKITSKKNISGESEVKYAYFIGYGIFYGLTVQPKFRKVKKNGDMSTVSFVAPFNYNIEKAENV